MLDGLLVVDKPPGLTSHDVVARVRKACGQRRVGHAGTLDPDATGVLLVGLGRVTRLLRFLQVTGKAYRTEIAFGVATDTLDAAGRVLDRRPMAITRDEVAAAARRLEGTIDQLPPMVSAVKIGGRRLHELAREGRTVDREARQVHVERFEIEAFTPGPYPLATALVECGSGTYVRTLAADLGQALGGCAHVSTLRRLRVGSFTLDDATPLATLEEDPSAVVVCPREAMRDLPVVPVDAETTRAVAHGSVFPAASLAVPPDAAGPFAVVDPDGELLAIYERRGAAVKPAVVLAS